MTTAPGSHYTILLCCLGSCACFLRNHVCVTQCSTCVTQCSACDTQCSACDTQYCACDTQYSACDTQYSACDAQCSACDTQCSACDNILHISLYVYTCTVCYNYYITTHDEISSFYQATYTPMYVYNKVHGFPSSLSTVCVS